MHHVTSLLRIHSAYVGIHYHRLKRLPRIDLAEATAESSIYSSRSVLFFTDFVLSNTASLITKSKATHFFFQNKGKKVFAPGHSPGDAMQMLDTLKTRTTVLEEDLGKVLKNKHKYKEHFPNADDLLGQVCAVYVYQYLYPFSALGIIRSRFFLDTYQIPLYLLM